MPRTVCLDEDKHSVTMLRSVKQMKHEDDFCDFTIKVKNIECHVHRVILAAGSPYFKAMLKHDTKESQEGKVEMKNVDAECVKQCIDFMYSGKFDIPDGKISKILHVAIMMQLDNIKEIISKILGEDLKAESFYQTRSVAELYQLQTILAKCKTYYQDNLIEISALPEFQNESKSHLVNILKSKKLKLSEDGKLAVCIRWVGNDPEKKESLLHLLKHINLKKVTSRYLNDLLQIHPVISNDFCLYKLLSQPLLGHVEQSSKRAKSPSDDQLLVLFDDDKDADCLRSYNPSTNEAAMFHDEHIKHLEYFTAVSMESYIYVMCINKSVHRLNFKDKHSKWERMQDLIASHGCPPPSVAHSGSLYVIGSSDALITIAPTSDVERFIPEENKWSRLPNKPSSVRSPTLVSLDDSIYCIGGSDGSKDVKTFCEFTPSISRWVDLEPMKAARSECGAVAVEQKIFVMGGVRAFTFINEVDCYDISLVQWTSLSPMIEIHGLNLPHHVNGFIFCFPRYQWSDQSVKYDIATGKWSKVEFEGQSFRVRDCCKIKCD